MNPKTHLLWELDTGGLLTAKYIHLHTIRRILSISASVPPWTVKACFIDHAIQCHGGHSDPSPVIVGKVIERKAAQKNVERETTFSTK